MKLFQTTSFKERAENYLGLFTKTRENLKSLNNEINEANKVIDIKIEAQKLERSANSAILQLNNKVIRNIDGILND